MDNLYALTLQQVEQALTLARNGNAGTAQTLARSAARRFPEDPTILHKVGVVFQQTDRGEEALTWFHKALTRFPDFPYSQLEIADIHRAAGALPDALHWYEKAAAAPPTAMLAAERGAEIAVALGDHPRALALLTSAIGHEPSHPRLNAALARTLIYHGRREEAAAAYRHALADPAADPADHAAYLYLLTELGDYAAVLAWLENLVVPPETPAALHADSLGGHARLALAQNRAAILAQATRREADPAWLSDTATMVRLRAAIEAGQPLSLIRLGDGEARFLLSEDPATHLPPNQAAAIGSSIWHNWFGTERAETDLAERAALAAAVHEAIATADIIGVPTADRLARDHRHFGYLATLETWLPSGPSYTNAGIASRLHELSPFYEAILGSLTHIAVISPHPGLAARLGRRLGIPMTTEIVIPGEMRLPEHARPPSQPHFPGVYSLVLQAIQHLNPGTTVLVAAGLLGKIYCAAAKRQGCIAIDIGSVADAWMGFDTRPGQFAQLETWQLDN